MLTFDANPMSRGRIARVMRDEIGAPDDRVAQDHGTTMKAPDDLAINPMGKVPTLVHDGHVVTEAAAICTCPAIAFPEKGLMAQDAAGFFRWMFFGAGPLEQAVVNTSFGRTPKSPQDAGRTGHGSLDAGTAALTGHLARNDYFADGRYTAADVYAGSQIGWGLQFKTLPANDSLLAHRDRIKDRPARLAAAALDDALLPKAG